MTGPNFSLDVKPHEHTGEDCQDCKRFDEIVEKRRTPADCHCCDRWFDRCDCIWHDESDGRWCEQHSHRCRADCPEGPLYGAHYDDRGEEG